MLPLLRFAARPKTLASMASLAVSGVALHLLLERFFPSQGYEITKAGGTAAATLLAAQGENIKKFVEHVFGDFCAIAASVHANEHTADVHASELEYQRNFNCNLQIACGRALAFVVRGWGANQPPLIEVLSEALAVAAEEHTEHAPPRWIAAAENVGVEIKESTLRDLCLNNGHLSPGLRFLSESDWTAFLQELVKNAEGAAALANYQTLWNALSNHLETHFPVQFYKDMKDALGDPKHSPAWASMQYRIDAYIAEQAATAASEAKKARRQSGLTHEVVLKLRSEIAADMRALWKMIDFREQADLKPLLDRITADIADIRPRVLDIQEHVVTTQSMIAAFSERVDNEAERQLALAETNLTLAVQDIVTRSYDTAPTVKLAVVNGGKRHLLLAELSLEVLSFQQVSRNRPVDYGAPVTELMIDLTLTPKKTSVAATSQSFYYKPHDADFFCVRVHSEAGWRYRVRFIGVQTDVVANQSTAVLSNEFELSFE